MAEFYATAGSSRTQTANLKVTVTKTVETTIDQASSYIRTGDFDNPRIYMEACMKLGSTIDSAIAMNAVPSPSHLPKLLLTVREVYKRMTELQQPSLMLLMLPIKAACEVGWFANRHKDELLMMAKEVCNGFSDTDKMSVEPSYAHSCVTNIVSRFYPTMKVENILTSFDVKAGYGTFVVDFHISHGTLPRNCRNLWLLVARMDNMDTSACIASPSKVDFLINGSGVPKRTKSNMGKGPQLPSNVTKMVKHGVNLLQVLGNFDGPYIIALAFMNLESSPDIPLLQDYVPSMSHGVDSDCESSTISLDCPISKLRIKTPVKGHLCNHHQCFDYKYFMEVNSRWPTWNCPICNNPLCNLDIRIDQKFLKILNEVALDVSDVMISPDGSWTGIGPGSIWTNSQKNHDVGPSTTEKAQSTTVVTPSSIGSGSIWTNSHDVGPSTTDKAQSTTEVTPSSIGPGSIWTNSQKNHDVGPSTTEKALSTTEITPSSVAVAFEQLLKGGKQGDYTEPVQGQPSPNVGHVGPSERMRGSLRGDELAAAQDSTGPGQSQPGPNVGHVGPSGRMRGSLRGDELAAARERLLAPPQQPGRASEPWSIPKPALPIALLTQRTTNNSTDDTSNVQK